MKKLLVCLVCVAGAACQEIALEDESGRSPLWAVTMEEAFPGKEKEVVTLPNGVEVLRLDSIYILGGDVILSEMQLEILGSETQTRAARLNDFRRRWEYGIVPYIFSLTPSNAELMKVRQAMDYIEARTNIRFWEATDLDEDYLSIHFGQSNHSAMGCIGGRQELSLHRTESTWGTALHELGHVIGLIHEQCRTDRDNHVNIHWDNIATDKYANFQSYAQLSINGLDCGAFDFSSIMLYSSYAGTGFALDPNQPIMTKKDGSVFLLSVIFYLLPIFRRSRHLLLKRLLQMSFVELGIGMKRSGLRSG